MPERNSGTLTTSPQVRNIENEMPTTQSTRISNGRGRPFENGHFHVGRRNMKLKLILVFATGCLLGIGALIYVQYFFCIYNSDSPDTNAITSEFTKLVTAWKQNNTNAVRALCVASFDPYSEKQFEHMNFQMEHQITIRRTALEYHSSGLVGFHPSARRSVLFTVFQNPYYFLGKVYF